jgi:hypothetical protein
MLCPCGQRQELILHCDMMSALLDHNTREIYILLLLLLLLWLYSPHVNGLETVEWAINNN